MYGLNYTFDNFILIETGFNNNINDCKLDYDDRFVYRHDRSYAISNYSGGGGFAIHVNDKFASKIIDITSAIIDQLFVFSTISDSKFIISTYYLTK